MKIKLKITTDALIVAERIVSKCYFAESTLSQTQKLHRSIAFDLASKLDKRVKKIIESSSLFQNNKTEVTLKYHEAWALHNILLDTKLEVNNDYQNALHQSLINQINQKIQ